MNAVAAGDAIALPDEERYLDLLGRMRDHGEASLSGDEVAEFVALNQSLGERRGDLMRVALPDIFSASTALVEMGKALQRHLATLAKTNENVRRLADQVDRSVAGFKTLRTKAIQIERAFREFDSWQPPGPIATVRAPRRRWRCRVRGSRAPPDGDDARPRPARPFGRELAHLEAAA